MNTYTALVNLADDPGTFEANGRTLAKLRVADKTFGKNAETRFFDVILGQERDIETAERLKKGDQILVTGQLVQESYKAKKSGKYAKKGQTVTTDKLPFATIMAVTRSPSFFTQDADDSDDSDEAEGSEDAPDIEVSEETAAGDAPLDDLI